MKRRQFLSSSLAAAALGPSSRSQEAAQPDRGGAGREYYELRRYELQSGPQRKLTDNFLKEALTPALNRLGLRPVGVFNVAVGPESPSLYVLIPGTSVEMLVATEFRLAQDAEYLKAGAAFLSAPAREPAYVRMESSLMAAFEGTRLTAPPATAGHGSRVFELRTYESPGMQDHQRKVEMFHSGEFDIFRKAGFWQIFYGDTLIGPRLPNLTYMLGFENLAARDKMWAAFGSDEDWKKLTKSPKFAFEDIVTNISNSILSPTSYSQI